MRDLVEDHRHQERHDREHDLPQQLGLTGTPHGCT